MNIINNFSHARDYISPEISVLFLAAEADEFANSISIDSATYVNWEEY